MKKAEITEIFSSIQGEGIFSGARQIFVRFRSCNMRCAYCDEKRDGAAKEYTAEELIKEVRFLDVQNGAHHSVSLTGGEPLMYADFLCEFLVQLKRYGFKTYLETNGTLPKELSRVINQIDIIAMDFKLPSSTLDKDYWAEHLDFLKTASRKMVFVKAVITPMTGPDEILRVMETIKKVNDRIPLILQPATPLNPGDKKVPASRLLKFMEIAAEQNLEKVRVMPQMHKVWGVK